MKSIFKFIHLKGWKVILFNGVLIISCSSPKSGYEPITEDFCSQIIQHQPKGLSEFLASVIDSTQVGTGTYLLEEGDESMIFRAWLSEAAERSIDIQYFIFSADNIGLIAVDYLLRAADRGVKVRVLVDDIMVEGDEDELLALDAHPNLSIKIYNPSAKLGKNLPQKLLSLTTDFDGFNQRMHNKVFKVDDRVVITGGRNIADEYFDYDHEYNFRDRDVLLLGSVVDDVDRSFEQFWDHSISVPIAQLITAEEAAINAQVKYEYLHQYACNPDNYWPEIRQKIQLAPEYFTQLNTSGKMSWIHDVSYVSDVPGKNDSKGLVGGGISTDSLIDLVSNAQHSILIQTPYLVTTALSQDLFRRAIDRGVSIKILTNSLLSTDNLEAFSGYKREREVLLDMGVEIYELKPDALIRLKVMTGALQRELHHTPKFGLHAKSMVIDAATSVVGTFNLDPRSANLNTECVTIIRDETISTQLQQTMLVELAEENAWKVSKDFNPDHLASFGKRFQLMLRRIVPQSIL